MTANALTDRSQRRNTAKWDQAPLVGWRQLCAIAKAEQTPDDGEWSEAVKVRLATLGFRYDPFELARAIRAVDHAHGLPTLVARPAPAAVTTQVRPLSPREGAALLAEIRRRAVVRSTP